MSEFGYWIGLVAAPNIRFSERSNNTALLWRQLPSASSGDVINNERSVGFGRLLAFSLRCSREDS